MFNKLTYSIKDLPVKHAISDLKSHSLADYKGRLCIEFTYTTDLFRRKYKHVMALLQRAHFCPYQKKH